MPMRRKGGDEGKLVEGVEEEEIERGEGARRPGGDEEEGGEIGALIPLHHGSDPEGGDGDNRGEQEHHKAQAIDTEEELQMPLRQDREAEGLLKAALAGMVAENGGEGDEQVEPCRTIGGPARRRAQEDGCRRKDGDEDKED